MSKNPEKSLSTVGTAAISVSKLPSKVFASQGVTDLVIGLLRFGVDSFDIVEAKRKWFVQNAGRWNVKFQRRFRMSVRGRPGG
jgi:hypothetical protein